MILIFKRAMTALTLAAFICGLGGCAGTNVDSGVRYNRQTNSYYSSGPSSHPVRNQPISSDPDNHTHKVALGLGVGTGVLIGAAALIAVLVVSLPYVFAAGVPLG